MGSTSRNSIEYNISEKIQRKNEFNSSYPGLSSAIQKSAGSPGTEPKPTLLSWRPIKRYPRGCRQERKKEVDVGRCETVNVRCETGMLTDVCIRTEGEGINQKPDLRIYSRYLVGNNKWGRNSFRI